MSTGRLILVGGGSRSGKSRFALDLACRLGERRLFVATAEPRDEEMRRRIETHRLSRDQSFVTVEEPLALDEVLTQNHAYDVCVVDCLTLWLSNLLLAGVSEEGIGDRVALLLQAVAKWAGPVIVVTNEVGMGIVPETPLGRVFRDVAGSAHQQLARHASEIYLAILGMVIELKPEMRCLTPGER
ncbi:MAG: adenosylcobinamide kinase/adenosylcobinamide phosphate guanyltransferase [Gemmatales bacterium]|nr:MAG: adenosylcobinamide kinase/adenosylcobinamide phosphate guanyltransferase [Gemmatales bacterium]